MASDQEVPFGTIVADRYKVIETIGVGGMSVVLQVADMALDDEVIALKLLFCDFKDDSVLLERFRNEVLLARKLGHPNITRIFDFGQAGHGTYFLTMEHMPGKSLGREIYAPMELGVPFPEALKILYQVALGLDFAHRLGVLHRDLKPDNILLGDTQVAKVSDFGLARSMSVEKGFTRSGQTVGTANYMAPEQLKGGTVDHRVDIYAFGIVAYETILGELPFQGKSYVDVAEQHLKAALPSIRKKAPYEIPSWFEKLIEKCVEKRPEARFNSMSEVGEILCQQLFELGIEAPQGSCPSFCPVVKKRKRSRLLSRFR